MKLNLGSGIYPQGGYINLDIDPSVNPDVVRDMRRGLPYSDKSVEMVMAWHVLEHLDPDDFLFVFTEIWRVLEPGGMVDIQVPIGITDDPTHKTFFSEGSFAVFMDRSSQAGYLKGMKWDHVWSRVEYQKFRTLHTLLRKVE